MRVHVPAVAVVAVLIGACGGGQGQAIPGMNFTVRPATINDQGQRSLLSVSVFDDQGNPLGGQVTFSAPVGDFTTSGAASCGSSLLVPGTLTLPLDGGTLLAAFSCCHARHGAGCLGPVRVDARWVLGSENLEKVERITVVPPDAGAGGDGGS